MSKISLKKVSREEFEEALLKGQRGYLKKSRSWKKTHLWWDDPTDPWFMHWAEDRKQGKSISEDKIGLLVASQMETWHQCRSRQGYELYLEE